MSDTIGIELVPDTLVLTRGRDFKWSFENLDDAGNAATFPAGDLRFELDTGGQHNALQDIQVLGAKSGSYTLGLGGNTASLNYYDITSDPFTIAEMVQGALEALPNIGAGNVYVHPGRLIPTWFISMTLNASVNEIQEITFATTPTSGTFLLGYGTTATTPIAYNATPAVVQAALEALPGIGVGNVKVTAIDGGGYRVEFIGSKAHTNVEQIQPYTKGVNVNATGGFFGLIGEILGEIFGGGSTSQSTSSATVKTSTLVSGSARLSEPIVNVLESTISALFNSYTTLNGVSLDFKVQDALHATVQVTSLKTFAENDLLTFDVDVSTNALMGAVNNSTALAGVISAFTVDFNWNYGYQVEFVGALANTAQPKLDTNAASLVGTGTPSVVATVLKPGKERFTKWPFIITGSKADLKVESEDADLIMPRTSWQLVFLPEGEVSGGDPIALGRVTVQGA